MATALVLQDVLQEQAEIPVFGFGERGGVVLRVETLDEGVGVLDPRDQATAVMEAEAGAGALPLPVDSHLGRVKPPDLLIDA